MLNSIPPFDYRGTKVSAQIPPGRAALGGLAHPRTMMWVVTVNDVQLEGFPALSGETEPEVMTQAQARVDAFLDGRT